MLKVYRILRPYLSGNFWPFWGGILCLLLVDAFQIVIPLIIKHAVDAISFGRATMPLLVKMAILLLILTFGVIGTRFLWRYMIIGISRRMERRLRRAFYSHLMNLSPGWFAQNKVGDLMALATNDLDSVRMMIGFGIIIFVDMIFLMSTSLAMMLVLNTSLTLYVILPLPILSILVLFVGRLLYQRFQSVQESFAKMTDHVREIISGIRVVKSYAREDIETKRFRKISSDYVIRNLRMIILHGMIDPLIGLVIGLAFALVLFLGGKRVIMTEMSMGDFVAFNSYLGMLIWPMIAVGMVINWYQRGKASLDRIMKIFAQEPAIIDEPDAKSLPRVSGKIDFRALTFRYNAKLSPVLHDVSAEFATGEMVGITGRTGSGKTTMISILPRLFDPPEGTVFIDGNDIRTLKLASLRSIIGLVPQDAFLFSASVVDNIGFGCPDAGIDDAIGAAKIAQLHKDVENFPEGYDTLVGERGVTLSGGQKQRLSIARALLLNPPILILDDALSAVDTETEEAILEELKKVRAGRTTIVVSHRVSALQEADRVVVIERGRITEIGSPQELIRKGGYYAELYQMQQIETELDKEQ